jgi:hypothetical protein
MYKLRFMKHNCPPVNIIFYLPSLLSSSGFLGTKSFSLESATSSWEKLNARKIKEMSVLRHICHLTNDTPWQYEEDCLSKTEKEISLLRNAWREWNHNKVAGNWLHRDMLQEKNFSLSLYIQF